MKRTLQVSTLIVIVLLVLANSSMAVKPGEIVNPNGFPSGPHYNLNIIGKKAEFICPEQKYYLQVTDTGTEGCVPDALVETCPEGCVCVQTDIPIYGNVVFVPEDANDIEVYMQSGSSKSKNKTVAAIDELQVTDPCAVFDGDPAIVQIPPNEFGYDVYARALAKPTEVPEMTITPGLVSVEDEFGNDLVWLGLLTDGFAFSSMSETITRTKGKQTAIPLTDLFLFTGDICYFTEDYCLDANGVNVCTEKDLCCYSGDLDPIYEKCIDKDPNLACPDYCCYDDNPSDSVCDECMSVDAGICEEWAGYSSDDLNWVEEPEFGCGTEGTGGMTLVPDQVTAYCRHYDSTWVFNIADLVTYLWGIDNDGVKLVNVRFYPRSE
ncbi:MAG: hypothetical protein ACMUHX_12115 [bacterium]